MDQSTISGICPSCGRNLVIPAELNEFSCMYCGARLAPADILPRSVSPAPDAAEASEVLSRELAGCILNYPGVFRHMTRKAFGPHFDSYRTACEPVLSRVESAMTLPGAAEAIARATLDTVAAACPSAAKLDEAKFTLCLLLVPALRMHCGKSAEPLCQELHSQWLRRWPKSTFQLVTYADIDAGFQRKKLCYITTAVCETLGKPDDCAELTAFRAFRDGYLAARPEGERLISTYYDWAPGIVTAIGCTDDPAAVYPRIWKEHLEPCYKALLEQDPARCQRLYTDMVRTLGRTYLKTDLLAQ